MSRLGYYVLSKHNKKTGVLNGIYDVVLDITIIC